MVTAADVVVAARALIGTPTLHQGRLPHEGVDCAGVLICVARALGLKAADFDITGYRRRPNGTIRAFCDEHLDPVSAPVVGGAVLMAWGMGDPQHIGIVVPYVHGGLAMVHADSHRHKDVRETRLLFGRSMRLVQAYAIPGVA